MHKITQDMRFQEAVIEYSLKHGVTAAAIRYKTTRQNIYRWRKKYDGTIRSLADRSHRPHSHPNQHTEAEIMPVRDMYRRNPHAGPVVFWGKLRQRGYARSISELYKLLRRIDGKPIKLPNPKYTIPNTFQNLMKRWNIRDTGGRLMCNRFPLPALWEKLPGREILSIYLH